MPTTTIVLYVIWFLVPLAFILMALWSYLEGLSGKARREDAVAFIKQAAFVLGCVIFSVLVDQYAIEWVAKSLFQEIIPTGFYRVVLLPFVLLAGAKLIGPTREILITRAPHPSDRPTLTKPRKGAKS